ncbi:MAG: hypothetical protein M3Z25_16940 [Actinomycetota bacterium]|nr:hypothetical protein [Actinomycetota bacterium]
MQVMVPVLTLTNRAGGVDRGACAAYAKRAGGTWLDGFLVSGSLGLGLARSVAERMSMLEVWLDNVPSVRLLACAWDRAEVEEILLFGVRPVAVLRGAEDDCAVLELLRSLPAGAYLYSHPQYSPAVLSPAVVEKARAEGVLVAGAKVSKVELDEVRALRSAAGPEFELFDGRCRHVKASVESGATGVVAVPLSTLPADLPPREDVAALQAVIDRGQAVVDAEPDVASQATALLRILVESL